MQLEIGYLAMRHIAIAQKPRSNHFDTHKRRYGPDNVNFIGRIPRSQLAITRRKAGRRATLTPIVNYTVIRRIRSITSVCARDINS